MKKKSSKFIIVTEVQISRVRAYLPRCHLSIENALLAPPVGCIVTTLGE